MSPTPITRAALPPPPTSSDGLLDWAKRLRGVLAAELNAIRRELSLQSLVTARRLHALRGTDIVAADVSVTSGVGVWATTPPTPVVTGNDQRCQIQIAAAAVPTADPGFTLTFADGAWPVAPQAVVTRNDNATPTPSISWTCTTTTLVVTFHGTPTAGQTYKFAVNILG